MRKTKWIAGGMALLVAATVAGGFVLSQYQATTHPAEVAKLGKSSGEMAMLAGMRGKVSAEKVTLKTIVSAKWQAPLAGLINLNNDKAIQAGLKDRPEPIQIFTFVVDHPEYGRYLIDTGVSQEFADEPQEYGVGPVLSKMFGLAQLTIRQTTREITGAASGPVKGVFLTHLHVDHISGLPDIAPDVPLYTGRDESGSRYWMNAATQGVVDALLKGRPAVQEWQGDIVDVFEDGSVYALHMPGHTPGSTAYLVNSTKGPVLVAGDVCHTRWGWEQEVEPGDFSQDKQANRMSLLKLRRLSMQIPGLQVRLGHQH